MTSNKGVGELEIQHAILELMKDRRVWTNAELKRSLSKKLPWSEDDLRTSTKRHEPFWENRVNNALSPSRRTSLYGKGHVENIGHGEHRITDIGYRYITGDWSLDELFADIA